MPELYITKSPVCTNGASSSMVLLSILTAVLSNVSVNAGSIFIVGKTAYPSPGFKTFTPITESKLIIGSSCATTLGAGYIVVSMNAVILGGSVYPLPEFNTTTAGKSIYICSPGICCWVVVPFIPRDKPNN